MIATHLFARLGESTTCLASPHDLAAMASRYYHRSHRIGGFIEATFTLDESVMTAIELQDFYNMNIGRRRIKTQFHFKRLIF